MSLKEIKSQTYTMSKPSCFRHQSWDEVSNGDLIVRGVLISLQQCFIKNTYLEGVLIFGSTTKCNLCSHHHLSQFVQEKTPSAVRFDK